MTLESLSQAVPAHIGSEPDGASENSDTPSFKPAHYLEEAWAPVRAKSIHAFHAGADASEAIFGLRAIVEVLIEQRLAEIDHEDHEAPRPPHLERDRLDLLFAMRYLARHACTDIENLPLYIAPRR